MEYRYSEFVAEKLTKLGLSNLERSMSMLQFQIRQSDFLLPKNLRKPL